MSKRNSSNTPTPSKADRDNRSRQLNPENAAYRESRGQPQTTDPEGNVGDDFEQFGPSPSND